MDRIMPLILSTCGKSGLSREESYDVFGQVSYLLLNNLDKLRSPETLVKYVSTMTKRETLAVFRRAKLDENAADAVREMMYDLSPEPPDKIYEKVEKIQELMNAVVLLPKRQSGVLKALYFDKKEPKYEEVAEELKMPVSSIGPTRARGLARLYRILKQRRFEF